MAKLLAGRASTVAALALALCGPFTGGSVALANPATSDYIENPFQPHSTTGSIARLGSVVAQSTANIKT